MFHPSQKRNRKDFTNELVKSIKKIFQVDESRTSKMFEKALRTYLIFTIKRFFKKKLFLLFINNLNFFFKRRRSEKLSRLVDFPDLKYCTDNAAMIALAGLERFKKRKFDKHNFEANPRWQLDEKAKFLKGAGVKI